MVYDGGYVVDLWFIIVYGFPQMGDPPNGWFVMEHTMNIEDFRVTPIDGNHYIVVI